MQDYKRLGYSDNWINQRLKSIEIRKSLTDEWKRLGLEEGVEFAALTDIIYQTWAGKTSKEYKQYKGLKKESLSSPTQFLPPSPPPLSPSCLAKTLASTATTEYE